MKIVDKIKCLYKRYKNLKHQKDKSLIVDFKIEYLKTLFSKGANIYFKVYTKPVIENIEIKYENS